MRGFPQALITKNSFRVKPEKKSFSTANCRSDSSMRLRTTISYAFTLVISLVFMGPVMAQTSEDTTEQEEDGVL